jgi:hypothetical protein
MIRYNTKIMKSISCKDANKRKLLQVAKSHFKDTFRIHSLNYSANHLLSVEARANLSAVTIALQ